MHDRFFLMWLTSTLILVPAAWAAIFVGFVRCFRLDINEQRRNSHAGRTNSIVSTLSTYCGEVCVEPIDLILSGAPPSFRVRLCPSRSHPSVRTSFRKNPGFTVIVLMPASAEPNLLFRVNTLNTVSLAARRRRNEITSRDKS
jgi:hypothetical protein